MDNHGICHVFVMGMIHKHVFKQSSVLRVFIVSLSNTHQDSQQNKYSKKKIILFNSWMVKIRKILIAINNTTGGTVPVALHADVLWLSNKTSCDMYFFVILCFYEFLMQFLRRMSGNINDKLNTEISCDQ